MMTFFHVMPRLIVATILGVIAMLIGVTGATLRIVALFLAGISDRMLDDARAKANEGRIHERPAVNKVDPS